MIFNAPFLLCEICRISSSFFDRIPNNSFNQIIAIILSHQITYMCFFDFCKLKFLFMADIPTEFHGISVFSFQKRQITRTQMKTSSLAFLVVAVAALLASQDVKHGSHQSS